MGLLKWSGAFLILIIIGGFLWFFARPMVSGFTLPALISAYRLQLFGPTVLPSTVYYARPEGGVAVQTGDSASTSGLTFFLNPMKSFSELKGEKGEFLGSDDSRLALPRVEIAPKSGALIAILPTLEYKNGNESWKMSAGLYHFTSLEVQSENGKVEVFNIGDVFLEVLPISHVITVPSSNLRCKVFNRPSFNPYYELYFENCSDKAVVLNGLHFPPGFPFTIDLSSFFVKEGIRKQEWPPTEGSGNPQPFKLISEKNDSFPQPVVVQPQAGVTLFFSLAPTSIEAWRAIADIHPVLETMDGKYILPLFSDFHCGISGFELEEFCQMLWRK